MPINITDSVTFTSPIQSVATGDSANQANFLLAPQGLANRTAYLNNAITTGDGSIVAGSLVIAALSSASAIPVTTALSFGTNPASAGSGAGLRFANNTTAIAFRNAANSGDISGIASTSGNDVVIGDGNTHTVQLQASSSGLIFSVGGTQNANLARASGDFLKFGIPTATGSAYASAGYFRFGDVNVSATTLMAARNAGNTADIPILATDGFGGLTLGSTLNAGAVSVVGGSHLSINNSSNAGAQVQLTSGAGGVFIGNNKVYILAPAATLQFALNVTSPVFNQEDITTASATGQVLTLQAQNATGTTSIGGDIVVKPGIGTTRNGSSNVQGSQVDDYLSFTPANGANNLTIAQSSVSMINCLAGATGAVTITSKMPPTAGRLLFLRNNTSQTITFGWSSGTTVTVATVTSALISADGTNAVKLVAGT